MHQAADARRAEDHQQSTAHLETLVAHDLNAALPQPRLLHLKATTKELFFDSFIYYIKRKWGTVSMYIYIVLIH